MQTALLALALAWAFFGGLALMGLFSAKDNGQPYWKAALLTPLQWYAMVFLFFVLPLALLGGLILAFATVARHTDKMDFGGICLATGLAIGAFGPDTYRRFRASFEGWRAARRERRASAI